MQGNKINRETKFPVDETTMGRLQALKILVATEQKQENLAVRFVRLLKGM